MIPVNEPLLNGKEKEYLVKAIDEGWVSSEGPAVKEFENKFSQSVNRKYGIAVCNGSAALDLALHALGISHGDEVIMPCFTIISPAAAVVRCGAKPVFVDSCADTWNMNVSEVEAKITSRTKAIIVVHIYGLPVDMKPVLDIAAKYNLKIIEDAAEMHGQTCNGLPCGSFGDVSTFSFYPNKLITTGEGGMIVCNESALAEKCRLLRNLAFVPERRFIHYELGWNYRLTNLQALLGLAQLERLEQFVAIKRKIGAYYTEMLSGLQEYIQLPVNKTAYAENIYWVYGIVLKSNVPFNAKTIMKKMAEKKIGTRPFFYPMHLQPVFKNRGWYHDETYPVAENMAERGFYIPCGLALTTLQMELVSEELHKIFLNGV